MSAYLLPAPLSAPIVQWVQRGLGRLLAPVLLVTALAGCAGMAPAPAPAPAASLTAWQGRFSVTYPDTSNPGQTQRASGRFRLEQRGSVTLLELANPIGQTLASARLEDGSARLVTAEGREYSADKDESLIEQVFGWRVPVTALPRWLRGQFTTLPAVMPGDTLQREDTGWAIRISAWQDERPRVLQLLWPATDPTRAPGEALRLQLIVDTAS